VSQPERALLATSDPVFAALCKRALAQSRLPLVGAVSPPELLESARQLDPTLILLDVDGEDAAALKALASKVMLVSDARLVLVSAYLAPGAPGLGALLQSVPATFVAKPAGPSSVGLAVDDGPAFVAALEAAFEAHDADGTQLKAPALGEVHFEQGFDAGWDVDEPGGGGGAGRP